MKGKAFAHSTKETRKKGDYYPTHYSLTRQMIDAVMPSKDYRYFDPATGHARAIEKVFSENGYKIDGSDIETGEDFLKCKEKYDWIVTNPPYSLADEFIEKARECSLFGFSMLLRTNFLSGTKRFNDGRFKNLKEVHIFTRMPDFGQPLRDDGKYTTAMIVYAWYIWYKFHDDPPVIKWIDNQDYVLKRSELT